MKKVFLVLRNEVIVTVTRRSFLISALGIPLLSILVVLGASIINSRAPSSLSQFLSSQSSPSNSSEGYVDESGLIHALPPNVPQGAYIAYPDQAAAERALEDGKISAFYVIPTNYLDSGEIINVRPDFNPLSAFDQSSPIESILTYNLLGGNQELAAKVEHPLNLQEVSLAPTPQRDESNPLTFFLPYGVTMVFYVVILMSASLLLNSITKEKENRVLEILMVSVTPRQMLEGKILGLGVVGLIQTALWVGTGYGLLRLSGRTFSLPAAFQLPVSFLIWGLVFFLLGYGLYASLMASVGALVPNLREASQATFVVILPLIIPLMMIGVLIDQPNGALATGLSLFPLTSPVVMMTRLAATNLPLWQPLLAAVLLVITLVLVIRVVAGMFRAQILLSGQPFSLKGLVRALTGR
jgi:ABC-2 type transport system permease protein